jgi:receptor protein-tyrosine kinase
MEGKTTVLTNLGVAAAEWKQRVLLIDGDLRRPRLHELIDVPNRYGFTDALRDSSSPDFIDNALLAYAKPTHIPNLWVLPSGPVDASSTRHLYSSDLTALLHRFRGTFDLVLIDTPPMSLCADARVLGRTSDGVVMVVRANRVSRDDIKAAYMRLMQDRIPVVGTILNDWKMDPSQTRAYGRYYDHYRPRPA